MSRNAISSEIKVGKAVEDVIRFDGSQRDVLADGNIQPTAERPSEPREMLIVGRVAGLQIQAVSGNAH